MNMTHGQTSKGPIEKRQTFILKFSFSIKTYFQKKTQKYQQKISTPPAEKIANKNRIAGKKLQSAYYAYLLITEHKAGRNKM